MAEEAGLRLGLGRPYGCPPFPHTKRDWRLVAQGKTNRASAQAFHIFPAL